MNKQSIKNMGWKAGSITTFCLLLLTVFACAKMGEPDGGWYDETPPHILGTSPADGSNDVNSKKVTILFDEFITLSNPTEKVVVSPPQLERKILLTQLTSRTLSPITTRETQWATTPIRSLRAIR